MSVEQASLFFNEDRYSGRDAGREALDQLFTQVSRYRNSKEYFEMLQFIGRLPIYAPFNMFLLYTQNPEISYVATARRWKRDFGRTVKVGAHPLVILAPMSPVLFVYDLFDTEGPSVPEHLLDPFKTKGQLKKNVVSNTLTHCKANGIRVGRIPLKHTNAGYCRPLIEGKDTVKGEIPPAKYVIALKLGSPEATEYATLVHEIGHILAGHLGSDKELKIPKRKSLGRRQEEMEAESISYLVCTRAGIETTSAKYLAGWATQNVELPEFSLDVVLRSAGKIEDWGKATSKKQSGGANGTI